MKNIREYHIESYWAEKAAKQERREELKQKFKEGFLIGAFVVLNLWVGYEFLVQLFGVL